MNIPWKGRNYKSTRLLLLGESAYSWTEDGEEVDPSPDHARKLVQGKINGTWQNRFMNMLSKALAAEERPSRERLEFVWNRVAFTNYISGTVGHGARIGPSRRLWKQAHDDFPSLLNKIMPRRVIVLGYRLWTEMPPPQVFISDLVQAYRLQSGELSMCWALEHPAGGLSWSQLANVIQFTYHSEMQDN